MWTESALLNLRQHFGVLNDQEKSTKISYKFNSFRLKIRARDIVITEEHYYTLDHAGCFLL